MTAYRRILPNKTYHIFRDPNVFIVQGEKGVHTLVPDLRPGDWCFEGLMWFLTWKSALNYLKRWHQMKSKGINYVVMANSEAEVSRCRVLGIPVCLMPQGQFINETAFPLAKENRNCEYEAFYAAQAKPFKRLHLAQNVENMYILTYSCPGNAEGKNDLSLFEPKVKHATWNSSYIDDASLVVDILHSSKCALALSKIEGAMWAVTEAHMCGIPVVSTKSQGGRDRYFSPENSTIVASNSLSVAAAVTSYKINSPTPKKVRASALNLIKKDRRSTSAYLSREVLNSSIWSPESVENHLFYTDGGLGRFVTER